MTPQTPQQTNDNIRPNPVTDRLQLQCILDPRHSQKKPKRLYLNTSDGILVTLIAENNVQTILTVYIEDLEHVLAILKNKKAA